MAGRLFVTLNNCFECFLLHANQLFIPSRRCRSVNVSLRVSMRRLIATSCSAVNREQLWPACTYETGRWLGWHLVEYMSYISDEDSMTSTTDSIDWSHLESGITGCRSGTYPWIFYMLWCFLRGDLKEHLLSLLCTAVHDASVVAYCWSR